MVPPIKFFDYARDHIGTEPLMHQATCLVNLYAVHGIDFTVLTFEITKTLRSISGDKVLEWLYYNAIRIAIEIRLCDPTFQNRHNH
ncbi:hypothetical protein GGR53DRAFT_465477 [Hypoxylon sp. FL1150]|nr:hypothetical protein GGR53DRAFT_465477 [Hypoxylon sp. FL1150]